MLFIIKFLSICVIHMKGLINSDSDSVQNEQNSIWHWRFKAETSNQVSFAALENSHK